MRQRANAVLVLGYSSTKAGARVNDQRSWALVFLAGILNLRRQLLADCCSGAWRGYDKAAFPRQFGLRRASYSPFLQSSVQFWGFVGGLNLQECVVFFCWMDKPDFHNHDDSYARRQNPETERNLSMYRSPPRRTLLGCAHLPGCLSPRRLLFVDGWDFPGFVFKRSPALAGSCTQCLINAVLVQVKCYFTSPVTRLTWTWLTSSVADAKRQGYA